MEVIELGMYIFNFVLSWLKEGVMITLFLILIMVIVMIVFQTWLGAMMRNTLLAKRHSLFMKKCLF